MKNRSEMQTYLEHKYDATFVVEQPKIQGSGIGVPGTLSADAYPQDNPSIRFIVSQSRTDDGIWDSYPSTVWESEERPKLEEELTRIFSKTPEFYLDMGARQLEMTMSGKVPTFESFAPSHKDEIVYTVLIQAPHLSKAQSEIYIPAIIRYLASKSAKTQLALIFDKGRFIIKPDEISNFNQDSDQLDQFVKPLPASRRK